MISPSSTMENLESARTSALEGKVIIFCGAGSSPDKRSIYTTVSEAGVKAVVLDGNGSWADAMVKDGTISAFYPVTFDADDEVTLANMHQAVARVRQEVGEPDGVCTFFEVAVPIATRLAASLGLPANPIDAVNHARDKHATRKISAEAGLPTPKHASIESAADLEPAAELVGFPAVIKPIGMFQSMGVLRVNSLPELLAAHETVLAELEQAQGAASGTDDYRAAVAGLGARMVLEEYLDGEEQVVDLVLQDGECVYSSVTDNWAATTSFEAAQGKFNETGASSPSLLTEAQQAELVELGVASTKVLGFRLGVFCLNLKYTSRGARLIEINSRMGGMFVRDHNKLCWGVDLVVEHLLTTVGLPCRPPKASAPLRACAGVYVSAEASGVVRNADVLLELAAAKFYLGRGQERAAKFVYFKPLLSAGDAVLGPREASDFPTWLCGFMLSAETPASAIARAREVNDEVVRRVEVDPSAAVGHGA